MDMQHQNELVWVSMFNAMLKTFNAGAYYVAPNYSNIESIANATDAAYNEFQKRRERGQFNSGHYVTEQGMEHAP